MARKVAATPTLDGEDAKRFLEQLEKPSTPEEIEVLKRGEEVFKKIKLVR